ncbi:hypothetical protein PO909_020697 [Leuciscus waleckii]
MPIFCVVYGCSNHSNREKGKGFYRVLKIVVHKGEKCKKLTEQRRKKWILNVRLRSGGAESANARVCTSSEFLGCPSTLGDVESVDWAPTVNLGSKKLSPNQASLQREQRMKLKEDQQRWLECAEAMLDLQQTAESPGISPDLTQTAENSEPKQPADNNPQSEGISGNGTLIHESK